MEENKRHRKENMSIGKRFDNVWSMIVALLRITESLEPRDPRWTVINIKINASQYYIWQAFLWLKNPQYVHKHLRKS